MDNTNVKNKIKLKILFILNLNTETFKTGQDRHNLNSINPHFYHAL